MAPSGRRLFETEEECILQLLPSRRHPKRQETWSFSGSVVCKRPPPLLCPVRFWATQKHGDAAVLGITHRFSEHTKADHHFEAARAIVLIAERH